MTNSLYIHPIRRDEAWPVVRMDDIQPTKIKIELAMPPNIDAIDKVFHVKEQAAHRGIFFCYGNTIYNPSGHALPIELIAHECTHAVQQEIVGVEKWWEQYLEDHDFRLAMELDAHRVEYQQYVKDNPGRPFRRQYLAFEAERLSGPLYNRMLNKRVAQELIKQTGDANG